MLLPLFGHLVVIKCEYKAERKCTWTAESSRMKSNVQLGLLCLSLLIFSLHGEVTESSKEYYLNLFLEEPDLHQLEVSDDFAGNASNEVSNTGVRRTFKVPISCGMNLPKYSS